MERNIFPTKRKARYVAYLTAALVVLAACGGDDGAPTGPSSGSIAVVWATTGADPDADGYTVLLDGTARAEVASAGSLRLDDVSPGEHTVSLSGVAENCAVTGDNPLNVDVAAGTTAQAAFDVGCVAAVGSIRVVWATTGADPDADGYTVHLDGTARVEVTSAGSLTLEDVLPGNHTVSLSGVAENCAVTGNNPLSVNVAAGATAQAAFDVGCVAAVGSIELTVQTTGEDTDPDGYTVYVADVESGTVDANGTVTLSDCPVGTQEVELRDVAANCHAASNPQVVNVPFHGTVQVSFSVSCLPKPPGKIAFASERGGKWDLYVMDGSGGGVTQVTDSPEVPGYSILLSPDGSKILYWADGGALWVVNVDGTGQLRLTENSQVYHWSPAWSPDGQRIAFARPNVGGASVCGGPCGIDVINADGSGRVSLTDFGGSPDWSPDGQRIVFSGWVDWDGNGHYHRQIFLMNADGTGLTRLTNFGGDVLRPRWSPDGSRLLFGLSGHDGNLEGIYGTYVMNSDGTGLVQVADVKSGKRGALWSPDGSRVLLVGTDSSGDCCLFVVNSDGTGMTRLFGPSTWFPDNWAWSPDGYWIAFTPQPEFEILVVRSDGSSEPVNITNHPAADELGSWGQ